MSEEKDPITYYDSGKILLQNIPTETNPNGEPALCFKCPNASCKDFQVTTLKKEIACTIYTHGITKKGQVKQHLSQVEAQALLESGVVIVGCMKQFKIIGPDSDNFYTAVICTNL
jgi:hypothetical protein